MKLVSTLSCLVFLSAPALAAAPKSEPYVWKSVQMVGGGFVDGIVMNPAADQVRYARTDMGGAYRWDAAQKRWSPVLDWVPFEHVNYMGVETIAVDPTDPSRVYMALGTYAQSADTAIARSEDGGKTMKLTPVPIRMGGNMEGRGNGERMCVDPNDTSVIYYGTRQDGLWHSTDRGVTWSKVDSFPDVTEAAAPRGGAPATATAGGTTQPATQQARGGRRGGGGGGGGQARGSGIVFTMFDPASGSAGKASSTIFVGVSLMGRDNFFRSTDSGKTWQPVPGQPTNLRANHAALASNGAIFISYGTAPGPQRMTDGAVWKFNLKTGEWTDVTPEKPSEKQAQFGYASVGVDPRNPNHVIASSFGRPGNLGGENIFRSTDAGATWKSAVSGSEFDYSGAPYVSHTGLHWFFDIEIDPFNADHAYMTSGYGGWETFNLGAVDKGEKVKWSIMSTGIEETVALELLSPTKGAHVITAIGDYGGFVHWDLDKPVPEGNFDNPHFGNTNGVAAGENNPDVVVRVGRASGGRGGGPTARNIGYSLDGGKTWQPTKASPQPTSSLGHIAVSSDGNTWVWTPQGSAPFITKDHGDTWTASTGAPNNLRVIADRVNPQKFYGFVLAERKLYSSTDAGATFTSQDLNFAAAQSASGAEVSPEARGGRGDNRGGQDRVYATPGKEGDLWFALWDGLYHSLDAGKTLTRMPDVTELHGFGFGAPKPGSNDPAQYMIGVIGGVRGFFRSDDSAQTWVRINDDDHQYGLVLHITGDPKQYGRVYVGTHGRGTVYGDPQP